MLPNHCPWTAAATALEEHTKRAWGSVYDVRLLRTVVDPSFGGVRADAQKLADNEALMAQSMAWARDLLILAAQHPEEAERFRSLLEARDRATHAARTAVAQGATTRPAGGTVISILDRLGPRQ